MDEKETQAVIRELGERKKAENNKVMLISQRNDERKARAQNNLVERTIDSDQAKFWTHKATIDTQAEKDRIQERKRERFELAQFNLQQAEE